MFKKIFLINKCKNKIKYRLPKIEKDTDPEFKREIWKKVIFQSVKELGIKSITLSFDNFADAVWLTEMILLKNIDLFLADSECSQNTSDYFLEKYGFTIPVVARVRDGMYVHSGGEKITTANGVFTLDLLSGETEYFIKNVIFPVKINSINILNDALKLTQKNLTDIIIKPCIILSQDE